MNIFYLDSDPKICAQYHCDKHVVKMILETAQMLSTAHHVLDGDDAIDGIYRSTHKNHPSSVWVRACEGNYKWTWLLFMHLLAEYTKRYDNVHATERLLYTLKTTPKNILRDVRTTEPPQCMPEQYKVKDASMQAYRNYYIGEKATIAFWRHSDTPEWWSYEKAA